MKTLEPDAPPPRLKLTALAGLPRIAPGDDLAAMILAVIAQKIVSKAEGRLVRLDGVKPSSSWLLALSSDGVQASWIR